jgi:predicted protein tyrosine phosphatase
MKKVLFVCSQNRLRSPTAEQVFATYPGIEVASAGLNNDAVNLLTPELVTWADLIFVMEKTHLEKLRQKFKPQIINQSIICLDIPDRYYYMSPELINVLEKKVLPFLP